MSPFVFSIPEEPPLFANSRRAQVCRNEFPSEAPVGGNRRESWEVLPDFLPLWEQERSQEL